MNELGRRVSTFSSIINRLGLGPRACRAGLHAWQYGATCDYHSGDDGPILVFTDYTWCSRDNCPAGKPRVVGGGRRRLPPREETT